jgi:hypothetical protein
MKIFTTSGAGLLVIALLIQVVAFAQGAQA